MKQSFDKGFITPHPVFIIATYDENGNTPDEVMRDEEGFQIMRMLARNMAWFLKLKEAGEKAGVSLPKQEEVRMATNYIR